MDANGLTPAASLMGYSGSYAAAQTMQPFVGYYYYNGSSATSLKMPYPFGSGASPRVQTTATTWKLQIAFASDINTDSENYLGIAAHPGAAPRELNAHKPPLFMDQGFLYFSRPEWDQAYRRFSTDFRASIGEGQVWDFEVVNPRKSHGTLTISGIEQIPTGMDAILINKHDTDPVDLRQRHTYTFKAPSEVMPFTLIVGTKSFIEKELAALVPASIELAQNFPNPFNSSTSITVKLPRAASVDLTIYSILGQKVRTLANGLFGAGIHTFAWDGIDDLGMPTASGVYLCRLNAGTNEIFTKKMILAK